MRLFSSKGRKGDGKPKSPRNSATSTTTGDGSPPAGHLRTPSLTVHQPQQQIIECDKQPAAHAAISIKRSDGARHDLTNLSSATSLTNVVIDAQEQHAAAAAARSTGHHEKDTGKISVSRSDGAHHDIVSVFRNISTDASGGDYDSSTKLTREKSTGKIVLPERAASTSLLSTGRLKGISTPSFRPVPAPGFFPATVRIVHMSDTHGLLARENKNIYLPHGNILVHTGNFSNYGTKEEFRAFNNWLRQVSSTYHYRVVCIGARDVKEFGNNWSVMKKMLSNATHVLCHQEEIILGIRFYGSPWHWGHRGNYQIRMGAPSSTSGRFDEIPEGTQVLVTHGPSAGVLDTTAAPGSKELAEVIRQIKPEVHLHGHAKGAHGVSFPFAHSPLVVNSAVTDPSRNVLYASPHVIKATQVTDVPGSVAQQLGYADWVFSMDSLEE